MRKRTLRCVSFIVAIGIVYLVRLLASSQGIHLPLTGFVSPIIAGLVMVPLVLVPMTLLNGYLLAWRKSHGRDIEEEEKYEFAESDIISLRPQQPHEEPSREPK